MITHLLQGSRIQCVDWRFELAHWTTQCVDSFFELAR